jgi:hypothetical protein
VLISPREIEELAARIGQAAFAGKFAQPSRELAIMRATFGSQRQGVSFWHAHVMPANGFPIIDRRALV